MPTLSKAGEAGIYRLVRGLQTDAELEPCWHKTMLYSKGEPFLAVLEVFKDWTIRSLDLEIR
jgi:hypothetical protein